MNIGTAIKKIRKEKGLTQSAFSEMCGISATSISQIENGVTRPNKTNLKIICDVLDIPETILYLYGLEESDVPDKKKETYRLIFPSIQSMIDKLVH